MLAQCSSCTVIFEKIHITDLQQMVAKLREDTKWGIAAAIWFGLNDIERTVEPCAGDIIVLSDSTRVLHSRIFVSGCLDSYEYAEYSANKGFFFKHLSSELDYFADRHTEIINLDKVRMLVQRSFGNRICPDCSFRLCEKDVTFAKICKNYAGKEEEDVELTCEGKPPLTFMAVWRHLMEA